MAQMIYPKYAGFIVVYAVIFLILGTTMARLLDKHFPRFPQDKEEREKKHRGLYALEIAAQISLIAIFTYIFREVIHYLFESVESIKANMYGNPDKFAVIILAPSMFSVQPNVISKIKYLWGI